MMCPVQNLVKIISHHFIRTSCVAPFVAKIYIKIYQGEINLGVLSRQVTNQSTQYL